MKVTMIDLIAISRLRMSTDGTGIRTLVVSAGCPLRCKYCINPHTWNNTVKPKTLTPDMLYNSVKVDNIYFQSTGGGITFGGGEPLLYADFIKEFSEIIPDAWTIEVETSLNVPWENVEKVIGITECFHIDIKAYDEEIYKSYTGQSGQRAFTNLKKLLMICPEKVVVRIPYIPKFTSRHDCDEYQRKLSEIGAVRFDRFSYRVVDNGG